MEVVAMLALPSGAPPTIGEAFKHIGTIERPTLDDLKFMVLVEAAGLELYRCTAMGTENTAVIELLHHNGRQELVHAHRVAQAIKAISGEDYPPPEPHNNPYLTGPMPCPPVTRDALTKLAQGEFGGEQHYETWATNTDNPEAARLFRLNGREEAEHGDRLLEAASLL